jgi:cytochrome c peroxidase
MLVQLKLIALPLLLLSLTACGGGGNGTDNTTAAGTTVTGSTGSTTGASIDTNAALLGKQLFSDTSLSFNQNLSCATCHNPEKGFIDDRDNGVASAVSLGDDQNSLGNRNSPTVAYASLTPDFTGNNQNARGGQFLDGRASNLTDQAGQPFLNALEMGMPDQASVIARVVANPDYVVAFEALYGASVFDDTNTAYAALSDSLASFQETQEVSPFDSKFDRAIAGTYTLTTSELNGQNLFFSNRASCRDCHRVDNLPNVSPSQLFTNHEYENIGVPANQTLNSFLQSSGQQTDLVANGDQGLFANPAVTTNEARGLFRVPTLRNVGVTGPYMHNGVFANLETVIHFYDHQGGNNQRNINPETNQAWNNPEVNNNISDNELNMQNLSNNDIDNLECFLRTLTDAQFEADLPALRAGLNCS